VSFLGEGVEPAGVGRAESFYVPTDMPEGVTELGDMARPLDPLPSGLRRV